MLLHCKNKMSETELIQRAADKDVKVYGLSEYYVKQQMQKQATILLGYANMQEKSIVEAVRLLKEAWTEKDA